MRYQKLKCQKHGCVRQLETDKDTIIKKQGWYLSNKLCYCPEHNNKKERIKIKSDTRTRTKKERILELFDAGEDNDTVVFETGASLFYVNKLRKKFINDAL